MTTPCPQPDELQALLDGELPRSDQRRCTEHLEQCQQCRQRLEESAGGVDWMPKTTSPASDDDVESSGAMQRAMDWLQSIDLETKGQQAADTKSGAVDFLSPTDKPGYIGCFGPYDVVEVVGRGGMGIVLKARDPALNRIVAIKVLSPTLATSPVARQRFTREARAAAAVSHDHVVTIHAVDEANRLPYLMMQFISGQSLQERIDKTGPLKPKEILRIGMQTASGLAAAHALGLVHRDVKPANVLLENGIERAMLTDFGLARAAHDVAITRSGLISGTPEYMSPEQVRDEPFDHRTDLFSFGGVLYAMCTGRPPFCGSTPLSVMRRVCEEAPVAIREVNEEIPDWLVEIVDRLLSKDPSGRYQSAAEVAQLLGEHLARMQSSGRPAGASVDAGRRPVDARQPHRGPVARWLSRRVLAVLLPALVIVVVGAIALWGSYRKEDPPPISQPLPSPPFAIVADGKATGRTFDTLAEAVHLAQPGDTIEVRFNGTFQTESIAIRRKPLVIRAAEGFQPTIEVRSDELPLFSTDASLALEGLSLRREQTGSAMRGYPPRERPPIDPRPKFLVVSREAELFVAHTRFSIGSVSSSVQRAPGRSHRAAIHLDKARSCELRSCEFHTGTATVVRWLQRDGETNSQTPTSTLIVNNCVHAGFEFLVADFNRPDLATVRLSRNTFMGARLMRLMSNASLQASQPLLSVETSENIFDFAELLVTLHMESPQKCITWQGRRNVFCLEWSFLRDCSTPLEIGRGPMGLGPMGLGGMGREVVGCSLEQWSAFWNDTDSDSKFGTVYYPAGTRRDQRRLHGAPRPGRRPGTPQDTSPSSQPDPRDFRMVSMELDDGSSLPAEEVAKYGADVERVGPGEPYDAWRKTADYRQWLERIDKARVDRPFPKTSSDVAAPSKNS